MDELRNFQVLTAIAFSLFAQEGVEIAVIEVKYCQLSSTIPLHIIQPFLPYDSNMAVDP